MCYDEQDCQTKYLYLAFLPSFTLISNLLHHIPLVLSSSIHLLFYNSSRTNNPACHRLPVPVVLNLFLAYLNCNRISTRYVIQYSPSTLFPDSIFLVTVHQMQPQRGRFINRLTQKSNSYLEWQGYSATSGHRSGILWKISDQSVGPYKWSLLEQSSW